MDDAALPDDEAFRLAVMPGSADDVRRERGVPRWSWDGLVSPSPQER